MPAYIFEGIKVLIVHLKREASANVLFAEAICL
jgi:hypothetical protein